MKALFGTTTVNSPVRLAPQDFDPGEPPDPPEGEEGQPIGLLLLLTKAS
jgi:hypothetical protein